MYYLIMLGRICKKIFKSSQNNIKKKSNSSSNNDIINPLLIYKLTKDKECSICWTPVKNNDLEIIFPFECNHFICYHCFKKWTETIKNNKNKRITDMTCPLCRRKLLKELILKNNIKKTILKINRNKISVWY